MRSKSVAISLVGLLGAACGVGPTPRDASSANVPIYNTAAVIENEHAVTDVDDSPESLATLAAEDRDPRDRALDARYQGADLLTFLGVRPGMRVLDLTAGGGYMAELLARSVGPTGQVLANDPPALVAGTHARSALAARTARLQTRALVPLDRDLASPLSAEAPRVDLVYLSLPYRVAEERGINTAAMNRAAWGALVPGGSYVVVDFRPRAAGPTPIDLHAVHRWESTNVRRQVEAAGFEFVTEGRFLRNDPNPNEWDAILAPNPTGLEAQDRFLLRFVKR